MTRFFTLSAVGLLGAGLILAAPQQSQAQTPVGVNVDLGRTGFSFYTGPQYVAPYYVVPPVAPVGVYVNQVAPYYCDPYWAWPNVVYPAHYRWAPGHTWHHDHHHRR